MVELSESRSTTTGLKQRKKTCSATTVREDDVGIRVTDLTASYLTVLEMQTLARRGLRASLQDDT